MQKLIIKEGNMEPQEVSPSRLGGETRRPYVQPLLVSFGRLRDLTLGSPAPSNADSDHISTS